MSACDSCGQALEPSDRHCTSCGESRYGTGTLRRVGAVLLDLYEVTEVLGQGGMSVVYKGRHKITGQEVALKLLPPELAMHREVKQRFIEEGRALARLDHPNIIHLYNFGEDEGCFVLAMQYVAGATWEDRIFDSGRLPWRRSLEICRDVLRGLEFAHQSGVIHRDMKPSNVLIRDSDQSVRITDFGIAKTEGSSRLTATGQTMGTVRYMSPEQVRGESVDLRTDIYSTAATLFESLVGDSPFTGSTHFEIMMAHLNEVPLPPSECGVDLPLAVDRLVLRGLAKKREDRPESAERYLQMVEAALRGDSVEGETRAPPAHGDTPDTGASGDLAQQQTAEQPSVATEPTRGRPALWIALAALVAAAGAGALFILGRGDGDGVAAASEGQASEGRENVTAADAPPTAPFFALPGLALPGHHSAPDDALEIRGPSGTAFEALIREVHRARRDYAAYLAAGGFAGELEPVPITLVMAPPSAFCDRRLYESGRAPGDCESRTVWYRPGERTAYIRVTDEGAAAPGAIREAVALATCVHQNVPGCAESLDAFIAR